MSNQWWLRTQDDVFGPVTRDNLLEWAKMGRIQPGQDVSEDGETWRPATEIDFLDMRWSIDIGDGTPRGPFNKEAAQALLTSGRLPEGSILIESVPLPESPQAEETQQVTVPATEDLVEDNNAAEEDNNAAEEDNNAAEEDNRVSEEDDRTAVEDQKVSEEVDKAAEEEIIRLREELALKVEELSRKDLEINSRLEELAQKDDELSRKDGEIIRKEEELVRKDEAIAGYLKEISSKDEEIEEFRTRRDDELSGFRNDLIKKDEEIQEFKAQVNSLEGDLKRVPANALMTANAQAAVYALMREEADELTAAIDAEHKEAELFREYRRARTERLLARRQEILRHIGTDVDDMTKRAIQAHPEDARTTHMRQEMESLRILQERSAREAERKINDLSLKLRDSMAEAKRLREQSADITVIYRQLQETREKLQLREKELVEERQRSENERQQHAAAQHALLTRISSLEAGFPGGTNQSREAHHVRLAPWMGLKK